jgi:RNA polymerase-binding transcription factor DksA
MEEIRRRLVADRKRTSAQIGSLARDLASMLEATGLTVTDDEHDPEGSTITFERSKTNALLAASRSHLADVDIALATMDEGGYGCCESCGEPIAGERLLARPTARTCIACAA